MTSAIHTTITELRRDAAQMTHLADQLQDYLDGKQVAPVPRNGDPPRSARAERMAAVIRCVKASPGPITLKAIRDEVGFNPGYLVKKLCGTGAVAASGVTSSRQFARTSQFDAIIAKECAPPSAYEDRKRALGLAPTA